MVGNPEMLLLVLQFKCLEASVHSKVATNQFYAEIITAQCYSGP
jgi:hypothetical protein